MVIILDGFEYKTDGVTDKAQVAYGNHGNIVPKMTAANLPSPYVVSASSELLPHYAAWEVFTNSYELNDSWITNASPTGWLKVDLGAGNEIVVRKYTLIPINHSTGPVRSPRDWTLQGSNNDSDWDILDTQEDISFALYENKTFTFSNSVSYRYYKIDVTDNNGDASYLGIGEMELYVGYSGYISDLCYGGTAYAESELSAAYLAIQAFNDSLTNNVWSSEKKGVGTYVWIAYNFPSAKTIVRVRIVGGAEAKLNFKDFKIQGSNNSTDGSDGDWTDLDTGLDTSSVKYTYVWQTFDFTNITAYTWIRLIGLAQLLSGSDYYIQLQEIEMMELHSQCYSESSIKEQGDYSMKIAASDDALNHVFVKQVQGNLGFEGIDTLEFDVRASRTGSNFTFSFRNTSDVTTTHTPNIASANTWQTETWDISGVADGDKDNVDELILQITNADSANEIYIDNFKYTPATATAGKKLLRGRSRLS